MSDPKYIIWDPKDGEPRRDEDGITSDGLIGRVGRDNAYVRIYAAFAEGTPRAPDGGVALEVGQFAAATFSLSGSKGTYHVYRVQ